MATLNTHLRRVTMGLGTDSRKQMLCWVNTYPECLHGEACELMLHPDGCGCDAAYCVSMRPRRAA